MVIQMNPLRRVKGTQLFTTAPMEIRISRRYIIVLLSSAENGAITPVSAIITVTVIPKGAAWDRAVGRKRPFIFLISDSTMDKKEGYASMQASIKVIWIGINGNA